MISSARAAAYRILHRVESGRAFAVDLLQGERVSALPEVDRRLVTELVMGVLRWRGDLDFRIEQLSGKPLGYFDPEVATVLRLGIYQIMFLDKVPKAAAVNEGVEMVKAARKRSAGGLVNAVLRKCEPVRALRSGGGRGARLVERPRATDVPESGRRRKCAGRNSAAACGGGNRDPSRGIRTAGPRGRVRRREIERACA